MVALLAVALPAESATSGWFLLARWEMNENPQQTVLRDASGHHIVGTIGRRVTPTSQRYHFFRKENKQGFYPKHVDRVPDQDALDLGQKGFAVIVRFQWYRGNDMNLVQKGQGSPAGGLFKVKTSVPGAGQPPGYLKCLFRGQDPNTGAFTDSQVESYNAPRSDDGQWHVLRCERLDTGGTRMWLDGVIVDTNDKDPGFISNDWPITIGGNGPCKDTPTQNNQCNYWHGRIGYVRMQYWDYEG
jgi:hypothetical protein